MRRLITIVAVPAAALLLTACSTDSLLESAVEEGIERAAEASGDDVGDVELDLDGEDGTFSIETDDGSLSFGGSSELPEDFPDDLPLPGDFEAQSVQEFSSEGEQVVAVQGTVEGYQQVVEFYEAELPAAGWEITGTSSSGTGGTGTTQLTFERGDDQGFVGVVGSGDGTSLVSINVNLAP